MWQYEEPSTAQLTKLFDIFRDPMISNLVEWGIDKVKKGDTMHLTNGVWTRGRFSEYIQLALNDKVDAERIMIQEMGKDFLRDHFNQIQK